MMRLLLFLALAFSATTALSDSLSLKGKNELSVHGSLDILGPNGDVIDLRAGYGWYLEDDWLVGWDYQWQLSEDIALSGDFRSQQITAKTELLFVGENKLAPFIGTEVGFRNTKFGNIFKQESGLVVGLSLGAKYFLEESVSINASIKYLVASEEVFAVDYEAQDNYVYTSFGVSAVF
jgi:hypothetical protein